MKSLMRRLSLLLVAVTLLCGCGKPVTVKWFAGIESELNDEVRGVMEEVASAFNEQNSKVRLELVTLGDEYALDYLKGRMTLTGNYDLVGPLSIQVRNLYQEQFMQLNGLIKESGYEMGAYDNRVLDLYRVNGEGLLSIPFIIYPSFIYYNKRLFDEAGLPYPPSAFGEDYLDENGERHPWNIETLRLLAMKLTRDSGALTPLQEGFNSDEIIQFGFAQQWTDAGGAATLFGPGAIEQYDRVVKIPANWRSAWKWYHKAIWEDHFYPNESYTKSGFLNHGDYFKSGNVAMVQIQLWYAAFASLEQMDWDIAVVPSYKGSYTARIHEDSFYLVDRTKVADAAFEALVYLSNSTELREVYDGMPADKRLQAAYFDRFSKTRLGGRTINWQVAVASQSYCDIPHHESFIPTGEMAAAAYNSFWDELSRTEELNIDVKCDLLELMLESSRTKGE